MHVPSDPQLSETGFLDKPDRPGIERLFNDWAGSLSFIRRRKKKRKKNLLALVRTSTCVQRERELEDHKNQTFIYPPAPLPKNIGANATRRNRKGGLEERKGI